MASSIFVLWNPLVSTKILPLFAQVGDSFFREQFVHSSLQLAQVAVDGSLRGAQLGGDLADGALHIKDARVVQGLHDADLFLHGQPVGIMSTKHAKAAEKFLENPVMAAWHNETLWMVRAKRDKMSKEVPEWEELRDKAPS